MSLTLILAQARGGVIGRGGAIPWHLPEDLRRFKALTLGKTVVMGRKTWESLPRKPLPGRRNLVVTRQADFQAVGAEALPLAVGAAASPSDRHGLTIWQLLREIAAAAYVPPARAG